MHLVLAGPGAQPGQGLTLAEEVEELVGDGPHPLLGCLAQDAQVLVRQALAHRLEGVGCSPAQVGGQRLACGVVRVEAPVRGLHEGQVPQPGEEQMGILAGQHSGEQFLGRRVGLRRHPRARRWTAVGTSPISPASRVRRMSAVGAQISSLPQPADPAAAARDRANGLPPAKRSTRSRSSGRIRAATSRLRACSSENGSSSVTCRSRDQAGSAVHCGCGARRPARTTRVSSAARGRKWCHSQLSSHWQCSKESTNRTVPGTSRKGPAACSKSAGSRLTNRPSSSTSSRPAVRAWSARRRSSVDFPMPPGPHT